MKVFGMKTFFSMTSSSYTISSKILHQWNTDDTDKLKPQFTRYRACFACPYFSFLTDFHG